MKINAKLQLSFLVISLVPLTVTGIVFYQLAARGWIRATVEQLEGFASAQQQNLTNLLEQNVERLALVSSRTQLRQSLAAFLIQPDETHRERMNQILLDAHQSVSSFEVLSVVNPEGTVVASSAEDWIGINLVDEPWYRETQETPRVDTLTLSEDGRPHFVYSGPLRLRGQVLGLLVIEAQADDLLELLRQHEGLGNTGETMLVRPDDHGHALVLAPLRHDPSAAFQRVIAREEGDSPAIQALEPRSQTFLESVDYRDETVLAVTRYLPSVGWGIVVKIDRAEALAPLIALRNLSLLALLLTLLAIVFLSIRLSRSITRPIIQLTETAARISSGDLAQRAQVRRRDETGILAQSFNEMAESLTEANRDLEARVEARTAELEDEINDRRAAEAMLASERNRLRTLIDNSPDLIYVKDTQSRFLVANLAVARLMGARSPDELLGKTDSEFFPSEYARRFSADEAQLLRTGRAVLGKEEKVVDPQGAERWLSTSKVPLRDADGKITGLIGIGRDITEHRAAEQALHRAEAKYRLLVEQLPAVTYIAESGPHGRWLFVSPQVRLLLGYTPEEWTASTALWLDALHPEDRERVLAEEQRAIASGEPFLAEYRLRARDGRLVWVRDTATVVRDESDQPEHLHGVLYDVTERRQAEQELQRTAAALEHSNRELEIFAYVASHDLQEPLRAVTGCVQIFEKRYRDQLDVRASELIAHIVSGTRRMQALITDLLTYSRVDRRADPFVRVALETAFQEALSNLAVAIQERGAVIDHDPLPAVTGDATQMMQLFQNLVGNAIKYCAPGLTPRVQVGAQSVNGAWQISVRDNGIGIDPQHFERIFGIFQRLHTREEYAGTGIGLALCKKIVERHGGRIWVESQPGQGATFHFTLPAGTDE